MKGESRMSSSSQMTCTAYSPGSVGQYRTSQEPSPLSSHSILACEGPSMEKPGARWGGSEDTRQLGLSGRDPTPSPTPTPETLLSHLPEHPDAPQHSFSVPKSIPSLPPYAHPSPASLPSATQSLTYPVSPLLCQWPPPQSQLTCPPGQSPNQDPRPAPSVLLLLGSPGLQKDWEKEEAGVNARKYTCQTHPSSLPSNPHAAHLLSFTPRWSMQGGMGGHGVYLRGMA